MPDMLEYQHDDKQLFHRISSMRNTSADNGVKALLETTRGSIVRELKTAEPPHFQRLQGALMVIDDFLELFKLAYDLAHK